MKNFYPYVLASLLAINALSTDATTDPIIVKIINNPKDHGVDLSKYEFDEIDLANRDLTGCNFSNLSAKKVNFSNATLTNAFFENVNIEEADFSDINAKGITFKNPKIEKAIFVNAFLENAVFEKGYFKIANSEDKADFRNATLTNATFTSMILHDANFNSVEINGTKFEASYLQKTSFIGATGKVTYFACSILTEANFSNAIIDEGDFSLVTTNGIIFKDTILQNSKWLWADINKTDFMNTDLTGSNFELATASDSTDFRQAIGITKEQRKKLEKRGAKFEKSMSRSNSHSNIEDGIRRTPSRQNSIKKQFRRSMSGSKLPEKETQSEDSQESPKGNRSIRGKGSIRGGSIRFLSGSGRSYSNKKRSPLSEGLFESAESITDNLTSPKSPTRRPPMTRSISKRVIAPKEEMPSLEPLVEDVKEKPIKREKNSKSSSRKNKSQDLVNDSNPASHEYDAARKLTSSQGSDKVKIKT